MWVVLNKKSKAFVTAIILAAGNGSRMGANITKQRITIHGESILRHTVAAFQKSNEIDSIVIVSRSDEIEWAKNELVESFSKIKCIIPGGKNRAESSKMGFSAIDDRTEYIAIHDGARCLVTPDMIDRVVFAAYEHGAATAATPIVDTLKRVGDGSVIQSTVSRDGLYSAQTPQIFARSIYEKAVEGISTEACYTDDNMLIERVGGRIIAVDTGRENIKITTPDDISYAEYVFERRYGMGEIRVGHGYDVHRLVEGRRLIIGGVDIPYSKGLLGHSDADVLTHAVMDALLGACALGDIGRHFPDTDGKYKDISSQLLLENVRDLIAETGCSVVNIDVTLVMQKPKVAPYISDMIKNISQKLNINSGRVNIKATTEEHLGFTGREEGISCHAVATVKKG